MGKSYKTLLLVFCLLLQPAFCKSKSSKKPPPEQLKFDERMKVLSSAPRIVLIERFLSDKECDHLIEIGRPRLQRSTVVDLTGSSEGVLDSRRSSEGAFLDPNLKDSILKKIEERIEALTQLPRKNGEQMHILHYNVGGEYQPHYDYFLPDSPGNKACLNRGGQRLMTVIMYLNTTAGGGETIFPYAQVSVKPVKGSALLFYNCLPSGVEDPLSLHGGAPVKAGEKWIATKWLRKGEFR